MKKYKGFEVHIGKSCINDCLWCFAKNSPPVKYEMEKYIEIIKKAVKQYKPYCVFITSNEKSDPYSDIETLKAVVEYLSGLCYVKKISILTSGLYPYESCFEKYKKVQYSISVDGIRETHDYNRGKGSYDKTMKFIKSVPEITKIWILSILSKKIVDCDINMFIDEQLKRKNNRIIFQDFINSDDCFNEFVDRKLIPKKNRIYGEFKKSKKFPYVCVHPAGIFTCDKNCALWKGTWRNKDE